MQETEKDGPSGLLVDLVRGETRVTILICAAAIALSFAGWTKRGLDPFVLDGRAFASEPWRLLSAHFVHANFVHLYFNLSWIWFLGREIERRLGSLTLLATVLFLLLGTSGALRAFDRGAIGLSGVVYGLWALVFVGERRCELLRGVLTRKANLLMVAWFAFCILATAMQLLPISNWGHGAGAVLGALVGLGIGKEGRVRPASVPVGLVLLAVLACGSTMWWPKWNFGGAAVEFERDGLAALEGSDWKVAEAALRESVHLDSKNGPAWWNLGCAIQRQGREEESVEACFRAFECGGLDTKQKKVLIEDIRLLRQQYAPGADVAGKYRWAKRAVQVDSGDRPAWETIYFLAREQGDAQWDARAREALAKLPAPK